jgi:hypothetical protein
MNFKGWSTGENEAREMYECLLKSGMSKEDSLQTVKHHLHINPIIDVKHECTPLCTYFCLHTDPSVGVKLKNPRYFRGWDRFVAEMDFQIKWESEKKRLADLT